MLLYLSFECFLWRDSIGNLDKVDLYCDVVGILWSYIPEAGLYCNVVGILLALYLKLLCGEMLGI